MTATGFVTLTRLIGTQPLQSAEKTRDSAVVAGIRPACLPRALNIDWGGG
jgi:hypothetical protein